MRCAEFSSKRVTRRRRGGIDTNHLPGNGPASPARPLLRFAALAQPGMSLLIMADRARAAGPRTARERRERRTARERRTSGASGAARASGSGELSKPL